MIILIFLKFSVSLVYFVLFFATTSSGEIKLCVCARVRVRYGGRSRCAGQMSYILGGR